MKRKILIIVITTLCSQVAFCSQINNGIQLYISSKGQSYIQDNIIDLIEQNLGVSASYVSIGDFSQNFSIPEFGVMTTEVNETGQNNLVKEFIATIKSNLSKFLSYYGNKSENNLEVSNLLFESEWDDFKYNLYHKTKENGDYLFSLRLKVSSSNISIEMDSISVRNEFLGGVSFHNKVEVSLNKKDALVPLELNLELDFFKSQDTYKVKVVDTNLNFDNLLLGLDLNGNPKLNYEVPEVIIPFKDKEIIILTNEKVNSSDDEYVIQAKRESEKLRRLGEEIISTGVSEWMIEGSKDFNDQIMEKVQTFFNEKTPSLIETMMTKTLNQGYQDYGVIDYVGSLENNKKIRWGIDLKTIDALDNNLLLSFNSTVQDLGERNIEVKDFEFPYAADFNKPELDSLEELEKYDLALAFDIGFFNQLISLSYDNSVLKEIALDSESDQDDSTLILQSAPLLSLRENMDELKMSVSMIYPLNDDEFKKYTKGSIEIDLEVFVHFALNEETQLYDLIMDGVNKETISFNKKSLQWWVRALGAVKIVNLKKRIKEAVTKVVKEMQGQHLSTQIPIPSDVGFLEISHEKALIDKTGRIVFYTKVR